MKKSEKEESQSGDKSSLAHERLQTEVSSKSIESSQPLITPNSSVNSSPKSPNVTKSKKRKGENLHQASNKKKEIDMNDDQEFETDTELAMKLSLETAKQDSLKNIEPQEDDVLQPNL